MATVKLGRDVWRAIPRARQVKMAIIAVLALVLLVVLPVISGWLDGDQGSVW